MNKRMQDAYDDLLEWQNKEIEQEIMKGGSMVKNRLYEKAVNKLIPQAEMYADVENGRVKHEDRVKEGDAWNVLFLGEMDRLCEETNLRKRRK